MNRWVLAGAGAAIAVAAVVLLLELRSPEPASRASSGAGESQTDAPRTEPIQPPVTPPRPAEINRPRPPIATRPPAQAIKPAVTSGVAPGINDQSPAAELLRDASNAYAKESYREALERAEKALELDQSSALGRALAVLSACGLGRGDRAAEHAGHLDERRKQPLIMRCHAEFGVELDGSATP